MKGNEAEMLIKLKEKIIAKKKKYIVVAGLLIICIILCTWGNNHMVVSEYTYENEKIGEDLDGYRIVQISDLHNKRFGNNQERLLSMVKDCRPDLIVITGDLVDGNRTNIEKAMAFIEGAVAIAPVYYVTGNHEKWLEPEEYTELQSQLSEAGAVWLDNEKAEIVVGNESFTLFGLDDSSLTNDTLKELAKDAKENLWILLAHEPQNLKFYSNAKMDFVFSGHAHGGQIHIPFIGGLIAPDQGFLPEYTEGLYESENTTMVVSRGLGNSIIPIRIGNFPEIVCVELVSK